MSGLLDNLESIVKLFADGTALFATVHDPSTSAELMNNDLTKISEVTYIWKILLNTEIAK